MLLKSYWNPEQSDHATAALPPVAAGYAEVRVEGVIRSDAQLELGVVHTVPLWMYYSAERSDYLTTASHAAAADAVALGYQFVHLVGHVWPRAPRQFTRSLKQYWHPGRADHFLTGTVDGERSALEAGYVLVRVEGFAGADQATHPFGRPSRDANVWWGKLHHGDPLVTSPHGLGLVQRDCIQVIETALEPPDMNSAEFVLQLDAQVSWWKEMAVVDEGGRIVATREAEGGAAPPPLRLPLQDLVGSVLRLSKARTFGVRNAEYEIPDLTAKAGKRVTLVWRRDNEDAHRSSISWAALRDTSPQGDLVRFAAASGEPGALTITLTASRRATWFKRLRLIRPDRTDGPSISTQDDRRGPETLRLEAADVLGSRLLFSKAMAFGVHTDVWELGGLDQLVGRHIHFEWLRDDLPHPRATTVLTSRSGYRFLQGFWGIMRWDIVQCDGDEISWAVVPLGPGREQDIELVVATGGDVTWWKALKLFNVFDDFITEATVEGRDRRSEPIQGRFDELWGANLVFAKAKFLGVRQDKYEYQLDGRNLDSIRVGPGQRIVFNWMADNLTPPEGC